MAQQKINPIPVATKGLYTSNVSDTLPPEYSPWCQNIRFRFGQIVRAPGRSIVLDTQAQTILDYFIFVNATGTVAFGALEAQPGTVNSWVAGYDGPTKILGPEVAITPAHSSIPNGRFSWAGGEDRVFVVRNSKVTALNVSMSGTTSSYTPTTLGSPDGCRFVEYFANRVFTMNQLGGMMRVQWSARANYSDWAVAAGRGGWIDLYDGNTEPLTGGKVLNDRIVIYRNSSITDLVQTGDDTSPFLPQGRVYGIGLMAPFSLASAGQFHIFLANDYNVYVWDGIKLNPIGSSVHNYIRQALNMQFLDYNHLSVFASMFFGYKEYWLVIPQLDNNHVVLIYDYQRDTWTRDVITNVTALFGTKMKGAYNTAGWDPTAPNEIGPCVMGGRNADFFLLDERIDGDRLNRPADGGMDMWVDTPDMYFDPTHMQNATIERVAVTQDWPVAASDPRYHLQISLDRARTFYDFPIDPKQLKWGFEKGDVNLTGNVRRYRLRTNASDAAAVKPTWRVLSEIYVPSGEFFPEDRPIGPAPLADIREPRAEFPTSSVDEAEAGAPVGPDEPVSPGV